MNEYEIRTAQQAIARLKERKQRRAKDDVERIVVDLTYETALKMQNVSLWDADIAQIFIAAQKHLQPTGIKSWFLGQSKHDVKHLDTFLEEVREKSIDQYLEQIDKFKDLDDQIAEKNQLIKDLAGATIAKRAAAPAPAPAPIEGMTKVRGLTQSAPKKTVPQSASFARQWPQRYSRAPSPTYRYYDSNSGFYYDDDWYQQNTNNALFNFVMLDILLNNNNQPVYGYQGTGMYVDQNGNPIDAALVANGDYSTVPPDQYAQVPTQDQGYTQDGTTAGDYPSGMDQGGTTDYQSNAVPDQGYQSSSDNTAAYAAAVDLGGASFS